MDPSLTSNYKVGDQGGGTREEDDGLRNFYWQNEGQLRERVNAMASERTTNVQRCQRCQGSLRAETAVDLQTGVVILQYVCFNCGRRWYPEKAPRPMTAA